MSSQRKELQKDVHLAVFASHSHIHKKCLLSATWTKKFLPNLFTASEIHIKQLLPEIKAAPTEIMSIHPAQSISCFIMKPWQCWTPPRKSPGWAWLSLYGNTGKQLASAVQCSPGFGCIFQNKVLCWNFWPHRSMNRKIFSIPSWIVLSLKHLIHFKLSICLISVLTKTYWV